MYTGIVFSGEPVDPSITMMPARVVLAYVNVSPLDLANPFQDVQTEWARRQRERPRRRAGRETELDDLRREVRLARDEPGAIGAGLDPHRAPGPGMRRSGKGAREVKSERPREVVEARHAADRSRREPSELRNSRGNWQGKKRLRHREHDGIRHGVDLGDGAERDARRRHHGGLERRDPRWPERDPRTVGQSET